MQDGVVSQWGVLVPAYNLFYFGNLVLLRIFKLSLALCWVCMPFVLLAAVAGMTGIKSGDQGHTSWSVSVLGVLGVLFVGHDC